MAAGVLVSLEEYLSRSYHPDCEYVGGHLVERNVGEYYHSLMQSLLATYLNNLRTEFGPKLRAFTEQRIRIQEGNDSQRRYRIPDVCVLPVGHRKTPVVLDAPALVVEILSSDDEFSQTARKCDEYVRMGVASVWIVDPRERRVWAVVPPQSVHEVSGVLTFQCAGISMAVDFDLLFQQLDQD